MTTQTMLDNAIATTATASTLAKRDANANLSANSMIEGYTTTATAASTTTLVVGSTFQQFFTGSTTQTVVLPVTSTLVLGQAFYIVNNSSGVVTVQSSGANTIQAMAASTTLLVTCINTGVTTAAGWSVEYVGAVSGGTVSPGTQYDLGYYATTSSTISPLATANSGVLVTSSGGAPSISSTLPAFTTSSITFSPTTGGIVGTTTNDNVTAGDVGEYISASIENGGATVSLSSGATSNVLSISLTAGDWDVCGTVSFQGNSSTTVVNMYSSISLSSGAADATAGRINIIGYPTGTLLFNNSNSISCSVLPVRLSLGTTTTVYLVANATFGVSTMVTFGNIRARRIR